MTRKRHSPSMLEFKELLWVCTGSLLCLVSTFLVVQALSEHRLFWYVSGWALLMTLKLALLWTGNAGRLLLDMELMVVLMAINCFINWTSWLRISICKKVKSIQWTTAWKSCVRRHNRINYKMNKIKTGKRIIRFIPSQLSVKPEQDWSFLLRKPYPLNEKRSTTEYLKTSSSGNCDKFENSYKCQTSLPAAFIDLSGGVDTAFGEWNVCDTPPVLSVITVSKLSCDIYGRWKIRIYQIVTAQWKISSWQLYANWNIN